MTDGEGLTEWLKWIAGGLLLVIAGIWQWMDRKIDALRAMIDALREKDREDRHKMDQKYQTLVKGIDDDIDKLKDRVTRVERNGKP